MIELILDLCTPPRKTPDLGLPDVTVVRPYGQGYIITKPYDYSRRVIIQPEGKGFTILQFGEDGFLK